MFKLLKNSNGYAIVEATILFPIIIMTFTALVALAMYLPIRAVLQNATQYTATVLATENSDTWLAFDESNKGYYWINNKSQLDNVYVSIFKSNNTSDDRVKSIVEIVENNLIVEKYGNLEVRVEIKNRIVYKEIVVTAKRSIPIVINLSFIGFPDEIPIEVTSTAVAQNGDEFIRNIDMAVDFVEYISEKYKDSKIMTAFNKVGQFLDKFDKFMGWN